MFCHSCGEENSSTAQFCGDCGANLLSAGATVEVELPRVSFISAVQTCLRKYIDFNGRATRAEFWWFVLFYVVISFFAVGLDMVMGTTCIFIGMGLLESLLFLAFLIPGTAVTARRLHDINKSGWWQLVELLVIPIILILIWNARQGVVF